MELNMRIIYLAGDNPIKHPYALSRATVVSRCTFDLQHKRGEEVGADFKLESYCCLLLVVLAARDQAPRTTIHTAVVAVPPSSPEGKVRPGPRDVSARDRATICISPRKRGESASHQQCTELGCKLQSRLFEDELRLS